MEQHQAPVERVKSSLPWLWSAALAVVMLGPALFLPGYVLSYDMVWVPDLSLRPDFWGLGSALPRAVPSDAVVAVLDEVIPGMILQKIVLAAALVCAGAGAARLVDGLPVLGRCVAASFFVWNPFVIERLVIGHWTVLVAYACLPWLVLAGQRMRRDGRSPTILWLLLPVGSLSAGAGVLTAVTVLAFGLSRERRRDLVLCAGVAAANAPWIVAGLLHAGNATADPVGAAVFALRGEGHLPAPLTALGLGGIWNSEVVPVTRQGALAVVALLVVAVLLVAGQAVWRRATPGRDQVAFLVCWGVGWGLAVAGWAGPDAAGWIGDHIPGGGLLRDGTRLLGLCALPLSTVVAHGAVRLAGAIREREGRLLVTTLLGLAPLSLMPDAGWGASGALRPVDYPASYQTVRDALGDTGSADVLVLPFSSYRAPSWNNGHKVLDPVGRYLLPDFVVSDDLVVSDRTVEGEDPRGADVRRALRAGGPREVSAGLADQGIGAVVVSRDASGDVPRIAGEVVARTPELIAYRLEDATVTRVSPWWRIVMGGAWVLYLLPGVLTGVLAGVRALRRRV